ncbi:Sphingomyelin synthase-related protein 1 [Mizuhopecten yessoensis]|uniref:Sphingomyelin synthase-related protein 1 n=1 Tax=Mizuhopecten yessoensis TaxID=6573 RepID=A0A210Q6V4_MIZYE|nr:Sphingomyelin synthase-related protein 1 [Mizuhopecten yessoensis]
MGSKSYDMFGKNVSPQTSQGICKVLASILYLFVAHATVSVTVIFVNDRLPDRDKHPPLPDLVLDNLPYKPWAAHAAEICLATEVLLWVAVASIHKQGLQIAHRTFLIAGTMYWLRSACILVTSMPVPDVHKKCYPFPEADVWDKLKRAFQFYSRFGLQLTGARTCGDYIFSGHTTILTVLNLFINEYAPRSRCFIRGITWGLNISGMVFILLCRGHYTIDVILAFYISYQVFTTYHHLLVKERTSTFPWKYVDSLAEWFEPSSDILPSFDKG